MKAPAGRFSEWPHYDAEQLEAVERVLRSGRVNYWTGEEGKAFEAEFAEHTRARYAVAVANGTVALELALRGLGVGPGDEVIVPCRTFIATASAVVACGATPVVADVDLDSQNLSAETISPRISTRTKALIAVHLAGRPCDMDPILALADRHGLFVIEDCAQAHGACHRGRPVGSIGDAGAYSFCQDKIISTGGEGGMLVTSDEQLWRKAWSYKDHGKCFDAVHTETTRPGFRWLHRSFGTNWRMTEMQAAIGRIQLRRLADWVETRRRHAAKIEAACRETGRLRVPETPDDLRHSYYRFYAFTKGDAAERDAILAAIQSHGVPCFSGSCGEIYLEEAFAGIRPDQPLPNARRLAETSLAWLVDPTLSDSQIEQTCDAIRTAVGQVGRSAAA